MRKVLYFLGEFTDQDIDWITGTAANRSVGEGETVVLEGSPVDDLSIVIDGRLAVQAGGKTIVEIGVGEVIGELSFLDSRPPSASVLALTDARLLSIPVTRLSSKLRADLGFASRFYRALGILLAYRLRDTTAHLAYGQEKRLNQAMDPDEVDGEMLDRVSLAAVRFDRILRKSLG